MPKARMRAISSAGDVLSLLIILQILSRAHDAGNHSSFRRNIFVFARVRENGADNGKRNAKPKNPAKLWTFPSVHFAIMFRGS